jgi:hypothetical protein
MTATGRPSALAAILGGAGPAHEPLFLALQHIWGKEALRWHREAVIFPLCPREEIRGGLSRGLSRTRMAWRSLVQRGQAE